MTTATRIGGDYPEDQTKHEVQTRRSFCTKRNKTTTTTTKQEQNKNKTSRPSKKRLLLESGLCSPLTTRPHTFSDAAPLACGGEATKRTSKAGSSRTHTRKHTHPRTHAQRCWTFVQKLRCLSPISNHSDTQHQPAVFSGHGVTRARATTGKAESRLNKNAGSRGEKTRHVTAGYHARVVSVRTLTRAPRATTAYSPRSEQKITRKAFYHLATYS